MSRPRYDRHVLLRTVRVVAPLALFALLALSACTKHEGSSPTPLSSTVGPTLVPTAAAAEGPPGAKLAIASAAPASPVLGERLPEWARQIRTIGRFVAEPDGTGLRFAWSGSAVAIRFEGKKLSVRLRDDGKHTMNSMQVVVDGEPKQVLQMQKDRDAYDVVTDLPQGIHEVLLEKRTEAQVGEMVLLGITTDGKLLAPSPAPERRIEIIGDSISTGYGNEGPGPRCGFNAKQENEYQTYGAITARNLNADHVIVAWAGKTISEMRELFGRALPSRDDSTWDTARYRPQVVVTNLGTNDLANVDPGEKAFVDRHAALVARLRAAYPDALIVITLGPMLTDNYPPGAHRRSHALKYAKAAVAKLKASGDANVEFLELPEMVHADGLGCGFHPGPKSHKIMSEKLTAFLKERMKW